MMNLVLEYFADLEPFVRENDYLAPATRALLKEIFNSPADYKDLELELAAFVDGANHFVSATYYLDGDVSLVFSCYERLATVSNAVAVAAYPNVEGVARRQAVGNLPVTMSWWPKPKHVSILGYSFFQRKFSQEFYEKVRVFLVPSRHLVRIPDEVFLIRRNRSDNKQSQKFHCLKKKVIILLTFICKCK